MINAMHKYTILAYYCLFILLASIAGGMIPQWIRLTHRRMEIAVSFVAGVMLGVALFHLLPHAIGEAQRGRLADPTGPGTQNVMLGVLGGFLAMFFIERFFCYHHHESPEEAQHSASAEYDEYSHEHAHAAECDHSHDVTWGGAALGLTLHSMLEGIAISAAVEHGSHGSLLAGFGTFLVIFLHKPLDSMTISMLMQRGGWSTSWRSAVNGLFALAIPVGVAAFYFYAHWATTATATSDDVLPSKALALGLSVAAGMFLCISLSDLLPELKFHQHDRVKLSVALLAGLAVAYAAGRLEAAMGDPHHHDLPASDAAIQATEPGAQALP